MDARKQRYAAQDIPELFAGAAKILVAKGKQVLSFDMRKEAPSQEQLAAVVIGPSGNLRAPTIKSGKTILVGFHEEAYASVFG